MGGDGTAQHNYSDSRETYNIQTEPQHNRQRLGLFIPTRDWASRCTGTILKFKGSFNDILKDASKPSAESCLIQLEIHSFLMSEQFNHVLGVVRFSSNGHYQTIGITRLPHKTCKLK